MTRRSPEEGARATASAAADPDELFDRFRRAGSDRERVEVGELIVADPRAEERGEAWVEVLDDFYEALRHEERFARALEVVRLPNAAGWRGRPDGRCDEAEMLLRVGRRDESPALFEACWEAGDEPWWVANNAGLAFGDAADHEPAVEWLGRGIEAAMAADDPERLVAQMCDLRRTSFERLGRPPDALQSDGEAFAERLRRRRAAQEERERTIHEALAGVEAPAPAAIAIAIAMAWFPRAEYERAHALWPDALERFTDVPHGDYCRAIEADVRVLGGAGLRVSDVAPVSVASLTACAATLGVDPAGRSVRAGLAAELARKGEATPWPPGRNDRCWCGRDAKYKRCWGAVDVDPAEVDAAAATARMARRLSALPPMPDVVAARRPHPVVGLRDELDRFAAEPPADGGEFDELASDVLYPHLVDLVRRSPSATVVDLLGDLGEVFDHAAVHGSPRRDAAVRPALAEAIATEGDPAAAFDLAERARSPPSTRTASGRTRSSLPSRRPIWCRWAVWGRRWSGTARCSRTAPATRARSATSPATRCATTDATRRDCPGSSWRSSLRSRRRRPARGTCRWRWRACAGRGRRPGSSRTRRSSGGRRTPWV